VSAGTFFTFPLCLLAFPADEKERLGIIVSHSVWRAGKANRDAIGEDRVSHYVQEFHINQPCTKEEGDHVRGAIVCGVNLGRLEASVRSAREAEAFIQAHEARYEKDPLVFISTELLWKCKDDSLPYRDFSTLAAVNSIIGHKSTPVLIRRELIRARQLGFKKPSVMAAEIERMKKKAPPPVPLTTQQLRDTLDRLEKGELIMRCQASKTRVYFQGWRCGDIQEFREAVKRIVDEYRNVIMARREIDRKFIGKKPSENQPRTTKEPLKKKTPKVEEKEPLKNREPRGNQEGTKREPQREPLKEMSFNKCLSINEGQSVPAREEKPSAPLSREEIAAHFKALFSECTDEDVDHYHSGEPWLRSKKQWRESSAAWLADRIAKRRRLARC
jgi:hypothetical protein